MVPPSGIEPEFPAPEAGALSITPRGQAVPVGPLRVQERTESDTTSSYVINWSATCGRCLLDRFVLENENRQIQRAHVYRICAPIAIISFRDRFALVFVAHPTGVEFRDSPLPVQSHLSGVAQHPTEGRPLCATPAGCARNQAVSGDFGNPEKQPSVAKLPIYTLQNLD
jgi:hypothetical protein